MQKRSTHLFLPILFISEIGGVLVLAESNLTPAIARAPQTASGALRALSLASKRTLK